MSKRLHVAKKYDVQYAEISCFNWQISEFHDFLDALDVYYTGETWDDDFEVSKTDWLKGINTLRNYKKLDEDAREDIDEALTALDYKREEIIEIMEKYLEQSDPNYDWLEFCFF